MIGGVGPGRGLRSRTAQKTDSQRRIGKVYEGAFESVFAILIGCGLGYWADKYFGTSPSFLLTGLAVGFGAFVLRLWKLGIALQKMAEGEINASSDKG